MGRQHVHFALRAPGGASPSPSSSSATVSDPVADASAPTVISGMRASSNILIWVDVKRSLAAGLKWWRSANEVILTEGDEEKFVRMEWINRVEKRNGEVIWKAEEEKKR